MQEKEAKNMLLVGGTLLSFDNGEQSQQDILIQDGKIAKIGVINKSEYDGEVIDVSGNAIVPGLMDMHVHFREPGREDKETIETGSDAAMAGGFTAVACMPNTTPPIDKQEVVRFILKKAEDELIDIYPIAAITKGRQGKEITEMAELVRSGAVGFSDDGNPVNDNAVMRHALDYSSMFGAPIIDHCEDSHLSADGHMNEGVMSTRLGIPGVPNAAESIQIARDIELARLTGGKVHIAHLSTREGMELVRRAKEEGLPVTCEVAPHHILFTDSDLEKFATNLKMNPPIRTVADVEALEQGIKDGVVDAFASDHAPHTVEEKDVEFDAAAFGIMGIETMLGVILKQVVNRGLLPLHEALDRMISKPRQILNIPVPEIKEGAAANISIFSLTESYVYDLTKSKSKSRNAPYHGMELPGRVFGVINKGKIWLA